MAKRQQQQDFLPSKALQPQQQIFDQYNAPKQFIAPRSELEDIGSALAGLSPTLKKFEERDRAEDAAAMNLAASKMSIDELRAASKRDFIGLQKKGVIPEGASPWAKVALLEAAGKRLAGEARKTLYAKLPELSQIGSTLTVDQVLQEFSDANGIDSIYAATAYNETIQPIRNAFENRVGEAIAQRTAQQNSDDLVDNLSEALMGIQFDESEGNQATWSNATEIIDAHRLNTGAPGHKELFEAAEVRYLELVELTGDEDHANIFLAQLSKLQIGTASFGHTYRNELTELVKQGERTLDAAKRRKIARDTEEKEKIEKATATELDGWYLSLEDTADINFQSKEWQAKIREQLSKSTTLFGKDLKIDEDLLDKATMQAFAQLKTWQGQQATPNDREKTLELLDLVTKPGTLNPSDEARVNELIADPEVSQNAASIALSRKANKPTEENLYGSVRSLSSDRKPFLKELEDTVEVLRQGGTSEETLDDIRPGLEAIYDRLAYAAVQADPVKASTKPHEMSQEVDTLFRVEARKFIDDLTPSDPDGTEPAVFTGEALTPQAKKAREEYLKEQLDSTPEPEMFKAVPSMWVWDTHLFDVREEIQAMDMTGLNGQEKLLKLQEKSPDLYKFALKATAQSPPTTTGWKGGGLTGRPVTMIEPKLMWDYVYGKAVVGASREEIKNRKYAGEVDDVAWKEGALTFDITDEQLNPKYFLLIDNQKSAEDFLKYVETPEGKAHIDEVYEMLPEGKSYKVGNEEFIRYQYRLLQERR